ncbi:OmpA family protein [Archangium lansingense]|uniref:OmpA family protein n=1 Tax=Archangium lansingense TaxID=2995310 RepID=UPI003B7B5EE8
MPKAGKLLADLNVADFIGDMALAVAEAQTKLDQNSVDQTLRLGQTVLPGMTQNLLSLGLQPAFYHFQYADLEMHLNIYYSTAIDFGVNFNLDRENESSNYDLQTEAVSGTATLTVQDGQGIPPVGKVALTANSGGQLTVGSTTYALFPSGSPSPATGEPVELGSSLWESAQDSLLVALRNHSVWTNQAAGDLQGVFMQWVTVSGVTASTNRPDLYACDKATITVRTAPTGAPGNNFVIASLDSVSPPPSLELPAGSGSPHTSAEATVAGALAEIGAAVDPAYVMVAGGECNRALFFNTDEDEPPVGYGADMQPGVTLDAVAALLATYPAARVTLKGWADLNGSPAYNEGLSTRRGDSMKRALVSRGVPASRVDVVTPGGGETAGFSTTDKAANRRVVLTFSGVPDVLVARTTESTVAWTGAPSGRTARIVPRTGSPGASPPTPVVTFRRKPYTEGIDFLTGATAEDTAENLANAIRVANANTAYGAFNRGERIYLIGPGDYALFTLFARTPTAPALSAAGSVRVAEPFSNGRPPASPQARDTVVIESVQLVAVPVGTTPQANEFALGVSAAETAQNLADAINAGATAGSLPAGLRAQAAGSTVTLTGPTGTMLGTSNRNAFILSSPRIGGRSAVSRKESSDRELRALNVDAHLSVKHELNVSGSSTIKARLVAVPAPPQFLQAIGDYLERWYP